MGNPNLLPYEMIVPGRPAVSRKPWTRFTALQQANPNRRH